MTMYLPTARAVGLGAIGPMLVCATALVVHAQSGWTVVRLDPAATSNTSHAYAVSSGQQAGAAWALSGGYHASVWSGTAASWVDLNPTGALSSIAYGVDGGEQVGYAITEPTYAFHASVWSGTAASWVDLHPGGVGQSIAYGVSGGQQVGYASLGGPAHAMMWSGSAGSLVDLHPVAAAAASTAYAIGGGQQAGEAFVYSGEHHASVWSGTAASWVDLNPIGSPESYAYGVSGGQQVGVAILGGHYRASLWGGSAGSWVNLNPAGALESNAFAVDGGQQVGEAYFVANVPVAGLWSGTSSSWVNLHALLPPGITHSTAKGIWHEGGVTYVVGSGYDPAVGHYEALLWKFTQPTCLADIGATGGVPGVDGILDNNDFIVFIDWFFSADPRADRGTTGAVAGSDGAFDNNDFIVFIDQFFGGAGC